MNEDIIFFVKQLNNGGLLTPKTIDSDITDFCEYISNNNKPYFLKINPFQWSKVNCCDLNVKKVIREKGGKIIFGFKIWSIPKMYVEASLHCIWEDSNGNLVDITPNEDGEKTVLFLPDSRLNTVRLKRKGDKPRLALKESLKKFINSLVEEEITIHFEYPTDEDIWNSNISYKELKL